MFAKDEGVDKASAMLSYGYISMLMTPELLM